MVTGSACTMTKGRHCVPGDGHGDVENRFGRWIMVRRRFHRLRISQRRRISIYSTFSNYNDL